MTLTKEILQKLQVGEGDSVFVTETADGIEITAGNPEFEQEMAVYRKVANKYRNALRELAK
jgi:putative addiction module antidote